MLERAALALGGTLAYLAGGAVMDMASVETRFPGQTSELFMTAALFFGVLLGNAGAMLLQLVTVPPLKMTSNVPFAAANFQTSVAFGLVTAWLAVKHVTTSGDASGEVVVVQHLVIAGFVLNLMSVVMAKMHWNFTENTGKALP
ncbi:MAG: hypothetical protein ACJAYU_004415 [Bradymonadia bacterium]